jgi:hypothetical protein
MRKFIDIIESAAQSEVVYHGSTQSVASINHSHQGIFFTPNKASAEAYARGLDDDAEGEVISARLTFKNLLVISQEWIEQFEEQNSEAVAHARQNGGSSLSLNDGFEDSELWARELIFGEAHRLGHDAVAIPKDLLPEVCFNGDWGYFLSYSVFDPSCVQIIGREAVTPLD